MTWSPINDQYEINICGEVRNRASQRILKNWVIGKKPNYYYAVWIGSKRCRIHQLIASRFLPAPTESNLVIDHIDRNRKNNHASNLRWVNRSANATNKTICVKTSRKDMHHIQENKCQSNTEYIVRITINKQLHYKIFPTIEEAKKYRDFIIDTSEYRKIVV